MRNVKWLGETICDICKQEATEVGPRFYDCKTMLGPWGLLCVKCFPVHGVGLGTGRGQVYGQVYSSKTRRKIGG